MPKKRGKNRNWQQRRRNQRISQAGEGRDKPSAASRDEANPFDVLPDEILFCVMRVIESVADAFQLGITCRRMWSVFTDDTLWQAWCRARYGSIRYRWFTQFGKDCRWIYRAHALPLSTGVGAGAIDNGFYRGDTDGVRPHGYGLAVIDAGNILKVRWYEGEWCDGKMHGYGVQTDKDGSYYEGLWYRGQFHGRGLLFEASKLYDGEWAYGKRHGRGAQAHHDQASHPYGESIKGSRLGCGFSGYTGEWANDAPHGRGIQVYHDSAYYFGDWCGGDRHGSGVHVWPNGYRHAGEWARDKRHGQGVHTAPDGSTTTATWTDDALQGRGVQVCLDGSSYNGDMCEGKGAHGSGVHVWADGRRYEGCWHHNQRHGRGVMLYLDGSRWEGDWERGARARGATIDHGQSGVPCELCTCMACSSSHDEILERDIMSPL